MYNILKGEKTTKNMIKLEASENDLLNKFIDHLKEIFANGS